MTSAKPPTIDYLAHLAADSARFLAVIMTVPSDTPVPSCPGWDADDLLYHLAEVQQFWATVVADRVRTGEEAESVTTPRPEGRAALLDLFQVASGRLLATLSATPPATPVWSWTEDHTAGFSYRRQAHEAVIHRVDAELTAGTARNPIDPVLAADGVAEVLDVMFGEPQSWLDFRPDPRAVVRLEATDTGGTWVRAVGHAVGTSPNGREIDWHCLERVERAGLAGADAEPTAIVRGRAADLDCWLWNRPAVEEIGSEGDETVLASFRDVIGTGIQ